MKKGYNNFRAIWFFLWQYRTLYATLLFVTVGYAVLESVSISTFLPLLSTVLKQEESASKIFLFVNKMISFLPFENRIIGICVLAISILIIKELLGFGRHALIGYGVGKVVCDTKEAVFDKYINSDHQFFLENRQGSLIYNLLNATGRLGNCLQYIPDMITAILMTITIGTLLFLISFSVTICLLFIGLAFIFLTQALAKKVSYHLGTERVTVSARANVIANELIDGIKHIKVSSSFESWRNKFTNAVRRFKTLVIEDFMWIGVPKSLLQLLPVVVLIVVALLFKFKKDSSDFLLKNLALIGVYAYAFYRLIPHLASFGRLRMQIMGVLPEVEILYGILHQKTNYIKDGKLEIRNYEKEIRFENVNFSYKGKKDILKNINFSIEKGKTTAIVGPSGMGKTTLVNLIVRLFVPDSGKITIDGVDLKEIKYSSLTRLIGLVSQDTFIFNATVRENIIFGLNDVSNERLVEAAKLANAHEFINHFPEGYDTVVGDKGLKLSGGQRQRIAIARAILRDPQVLILDEATSSLDYHSEALVQNAINKVSKNRTVIVIAHRLSTVINADKIIVLDHGKVTEQGKHNELIKRNGTYRALYESQENKLQELEL